MKLKTKAWAIVARYNCRENICPNSVRATKKDAGSEMRATFGSWLRKQMKMRIVRVTITADVRKDKL